MKIDYLILGAGPAGLTIANLLKQNGVESFLVLEKEKDVGGLCRSVEVDGSPFDIGGGHFLDVRRPKVNNFLFQFMPRDEWNLFKRDSRIVVNENEIGHPIEANIWQMKIDEQVRYLKSIACAGCNRGEKKPEDFVPWIYWKLGERIAEDYMIPYNQKMFSRELDQLGTYWLEKLPDVSFEETLRSCLEKKPYGTQPGHAEFYYPKKYGYGELWRRMGSVLGDKLSCSCKVCGIDFDKKEVITNRGIISFNTVFVTVPWTSFESLKGLPETIRHGIEFLRYSSIETRYFSTRMETKAHWIYYPDPELPYHRILVRSNFCPGSNGYWTETNRERTAMFAEGSQKQFHHMNEYAYPLNTREKPAAIEALLSWTKSRGVIGVGRWGEWQHYNSDVTVERAMTVVSELGKE